MTFTFDFYVILIGQFQVVLEQLEFFPPHFFMFCFNIIIQTFSLCYFIKKFKKKKFTLTFDLYFILTEKGQHFNLNLKNFQER